MSTSNNLLLQTSSTAQPKPRARPLTPWELPSLLTPMYRYKPGRTTKPKDRRHHAAVLGYVYRNRFAVASQIQRRFADILRSDRTARRHLAEMQELGYLDLAPTRSTSPLWPKVFYVTGRGLRKLSKSLAGRGKPAKLGRADRSLRDGYSADHVVHEVLTTEFLLTLWQTVEARPDLELLTVQRRSLERHPAFRMQLDGGHVRVKPDAMFLFRQVGGGLMVCFLELDRGTMSREQLLAKYRRYRIWSESSAGYQFLVDLYRKHGAAAAKQVFRLLMVGQARSGPDESRLRELMAPLTELPANFRSRVWVTTVAALREQQQERAPLDGMIWTRPISAFMTDGAAKSCLFPK